MTSGRDTDGMPAVRGEHPYGVSVWHYYANPISPVYSASVRRRAGLGCS